jgi:DNA-binding NarL/FixJ family response regulator
MIIRVAAVVRSPSILKGLRKNLAGDPGLELVAWFRTGKEALAAFSRTRPDVLLFDITVQKSRAEDMLRKLSRRKTRPRLVLLIQDRRDDILEAMKLGADGAVLADAGLEVISECIQYVHAGKKWLEQDHAARLLDKLVSRDHGMRELSQVLTRRQLEVACMIAKGMPNSALAKELLITESSVKLHLNRLYAKFNAGGRAELVQFLNSRGLT